MAHFASLEHRSGYAPTPQEAEQEETYIASHYGGWKHVRSFVRKALQRHDETSLTFADALKAAQEVTDDFEALSVEECQDMKKDLSAMPTEHTGQVLLADLHRRALEGHMEF